VFDRVESLLEVNKAVIYIGQLFRFAFSASSLRIKIWWVVFQSFLNLACSSDRCGSICAFSLSSYTIIKILLAWLSSEIVL